MGNSIIRGQPWSIRLRLKSEQIVVSNIQGIYLAVVQGANKTVKIFADGVSKWTLNSSQNTVTCQLSAANTNTLTAGIRAGISAHITDTSGVKSEVFAGIYAVENSGSTYVLPDILDANIQSGQTIPDSEVDADLRPVTFTSNGTYTPSGFDGYSQVTVNVGAPSGTKQITITENGTITENVANYANAAITTNVVNQDYLASLTALGVTEDLADSIGALTTYANGVTGESDTTLSDAVESLADGYGGGGGFSQGIEVVTDANGYITDYIFHGFSKIPKYALNYNGYDRAQTTGVPLISFADKPTVCESMAFKLANAKIDWSGLSELEKVGSDYVFSINYGLNNNQTSQIVNLPKFKGYVDSTYSGMNMFRQRSNNIPYAPLTYNLPVCEIIPQYAWCNFAGTGISITIGSIGHGVKESKTGPFSATPNANGTITIYTTGDKLDSIKASVLGGNPGSGLNFVYKASEATTYNGTSYSAGDTITV